jgi:hypothetical protein
MLPDGFTGASKKYDKNGNSLYHRFEESKMEVGEISIEGEVMKPGKVELGNFYKREIFIKEANAKGTDSLAFIGAYRYRGYSLFDLLNPFIVQKKNSETFRPEIDLYIIVENAAGDKISFSWAEIFHTNIPHQVLIATESSPIKPYKKEVEYSVSKEWKLVAGGDFFSSRTLPNPTKITVKSFDKKEYTIVKGMRPAFSPKVDVFVDNAKQMEIPQVPQSINNRRYRSNFYGMGMGYHDTPIFQGIELEKAISQVTDNLDDSWKRSGLVCFVGVDGYRAVYSYSELFNRLDQQQAILSIPDQPQEVGYYRMYHPMVFWADYSVKGLMEIYMFQD